MEAVLSPQQTTRQIPFTFKNFETKMSPVTVKRHGIKNLVRVGQKLQTSSDWSDHKLHKVRIPVWPL